MKKIMFSLIILSMVFTLGQNKMYIWKNSAITDSMNITKDLKISFKNASPTIPTEGLVAWYPFNGSANDESGHALNGTTNSGVTWGIDRHGNQSTAALFNGTSGKIIVSDNDLLDLTQDFTICAWLMPADTVNTNIFISKHQNSTNSDGSWFLETNRNNYKIDFQCVANSSWSSHTTQEFINASSWFFSVFSFNKATNNWKFYINGVLNSSGTAPFDIRNNNKNFVIGNETTTQSANFYKGILDDIRIYNRTLFDDEIQSLYQEK